MSFDNGNPTHIQYQEFVCPDGYVQTKVPLRSIRFLDPADLEARILGADQERYAAYSDHIKNGRYANGVPIVYRTPKGTLFASHLRNSDLVLHAEQNVPVLAGVPRNTIHPMMSVKIIEVTSFDDIATQTAIYLEKQNVGS